MIPGIAGGGADIVEFGGAMAPVPGIAGGADMAGFGTAEAPGIPEGAGIVVLGMVAAPFIPGRDSEENGGGAKLLGLGEGNPEGTVAAKFPKAGGSEPVGGNEG